jgi:hypothetical protein
LPAPEAPRPAKGILLTACFPALLAAAEIFGIRALTWAPAVLARSGALAAACFVSPVALAAAACVVLRTAGWPVILRPRPASWS